jgi:hypothetical protein
MGKYKETKKQAEKSQQDYLEQLKNLTPPEMIQDEMANLDPELYARQIRALNEFQNQYDTGGMTSADKAALELNQRDAAQFSRAQRDATAQRMASQGQAGSGLSRAMNIAGEEAATDRAYYGGRQNQVDARQRALQALQANLAGSSGLRGQEMNRMNSKNAINQFNANNTMQFNRDKLNAAGEANNQYQQNYDRKRETLGNVFQGIGDVAGIGMDLFTGGKKFTNPFK